LAARLAANYLAADWLSCRAALLAAFTVAALIIRSGIDWKCTNEAARREEIDQKNIFASRLASPGHPLDLSYRRAPWGEMAAKRALLTYIG